MNLIKHSKYKNSGILFELLIRQITADTLDGRDSKVKDLLKKYFVKTELGKEYKLYETLIKKTTVPESQANIIIDTLVESSKNLNRSLLKKQKYNLIKEIKDNYDVNEFFNHKLPNYKTYAAFYTLIESHNNPTLQNPEQIINNKVTILEHLTIAPIKTTVNKSEVLEEFNKADKDIKLLTYKIALEKFNSKYNHLDENQKNILKEYINSVDNLPRLKDYYISKLIEVKNILTSLNASTTNAVTKIKIDEIISIIPTPSKTLKINDGNLVDLLQYYDLIKELKLTNGTN
jgi:hypothetical protein